MIATCGPHIATIPHWACFRITLSACGNRLNEVRQVREREINWSKPRTGKGEESKAEEKRRNIM
jgi:hypothetical protein